MRDSYLKYIKYSWKSKVKNQTDKKSMSKNEQKTQRDILLRRMANKHMKRCLTLLSILEM